MAGHFFWFLEKMLGAKWGVVYGYGLATRITLIYPEFEGWPLGISPGIPSHPPGLSTTMPILTGGCMVLSLAKTLRGVPDSTFESTPPW